MHRLFAMLRQFLRDTRGSISMETVIVMPVLCWTLMASFVYWDTFRSQNAHLKASYAVADMLTREMTAINNAYITGMHNVYRYMMQTSEPTWMRVTSVQFRASDNSYRVLWSRTTNATRAPQMTNTMLSNMRARMPLMANDDTVIVVETWREYQPVFDIGLGRRIFEEFIVTRPRWLSPLPLTA